MGGWRGFLCEDRSGNVWSGGNGLYRMKENGDTVSFERVELNLPAPLSGEFGVNSALEGHDGSLWLVTNWGIVRRLPDGRRVFYSVEPSRTDTLTSALEDRGGSIWVGRPSGFMSSSPNPSTRWHTLAL
jgi:ligand-binding sensor domain-containing protein